MVGCVPAVISRPSGAAARARSARAAASEATALSTSGHGGVTISSCAAGSSSLKRGSSGHLEDLARLGKQVERLAVEQEELLLDPDAERVRRVEARAQAVGVHVAQPPWSRAAFGPPWNG